MSPRHSCRAPQDCSATESVSCQGAAACGCCACDTFACYLHGFCSLRHGTKALKDGNGLSKVQQGVTQHALTGEEML